MISLTISLNFCSYDYVEVWDGAKGNLGPWNKTATLCRRNQRGQVFFSSGAAAKLRFVTDGSIQYYGFKVKVQTGMQMTFFIQNCMGTNLFIVKWHQTYYLRCVCLTFYFNHI